MVGGPPIPGKKLRRAKIPASVKRGILKAAGGKCANPGCASRLINFHHMDQWHIHHRHNPDRMVPICPTCHSHIHQTHGIPISDKETAMWKLIRRASDEVARASHLYVEPGLPASVILGTTRFTTCNDRVLLLHLSERNHLSFKIVNGSILLLDLAMSNPRSVPLLTVTDSHTLTSNDPAVRCDARPGRIRVTTPATTDYLDAVTLAVCKEPDVGLVTDGLLTLADLQVVAPGTVKLTGVWAESGIAVVAARDLLLFRRLGTEGFGRLIGYHAVRGDLSGGGGAVEHYPVVRFEGAINCAVLEEVFRLRASG